MTKYSSCDPQMPVSRGTAIDRLRRAGHTDAAQALKQWRSKVGTYQGWDGFVRSAWPNLIPVIWDWQRYLSKS